MNLQTAQARILSAYPELVYEPGGWVSLRRLREHLPGVPKTLMDEALRAMHIAGTIALIAEVNQRALTDADHAAAVSAAGDWKNLYRVR